MTRPWITVQIAVVLLGSSSNATNYRWFTSQRVSGGNPTHAPVTAKQAAVAGAVLLAYGSVK
jgi:hypothetical protein